MTGTQILDRISMRGNSWEFVLVGQTAIAFRFLDQGASSAFERLLLLLFPFSRPLLIRGADLRLAHLFLKLMLVIQAGEALLAVANHHLGDPLGNP